jgi:hypothetical protein
VLIDQIKYVSIWKKASEKWKLYVLNQSKKKTEVSCMFCDVSPKLVKVVRCILQRRPQTYIHSLTRSN